MNTKNIAISAIVVTLGLFIGRISGFFREIVIANQVGANERSDLIVLMLTTPDFLVSLLMGGAMSMALIPEFKRLESSHARLLYQQVSGCMLVLGLLFVAIAYVFQGDILSSLALGMDEVFIEEHKHVFFLSLYALPFSLATGASLAYLNSLERFTITSLSTLIVNVVVIVAILLSAYNGVSFVYIAWGVILAALLRWLSQVFALRIVPISFGSNWLVSKELIKRYTYALLSGGVIFALPVVVRTVASMDGQGALSIVNYTTKLVELPLIVLSSAFSIVLLPKLSNDFANGNEIEFNRTSVLVLLLVFFVSALVLIPLKIHSELVSQVVYGWGELDRVQLGHIGEYLSVYSLSLPFQCVNGIFLAVFSARCDTKTPFFVTTVLGCCLFGFLLAVKPSVFELFYALVAFYVTMSLSFLAILRLKHGIDLRQLSFRWLFYGVITFIFTAMLVALTKSLLLSLTPLLSVTLLGVVVVIMLAMFLVGCRRSFINRD